MNVFDFDETIYEGDSTRDFVFWCLKRHPKTLLSVPKTGIAAFGYYVCHIGTKTQFKERMYGFLKGVDTESEVEQFWSEKLSGVKAFYLQIHNDDDVIISASPEFLLKPLEKKLGITVITSKVDPHTGKYTGVNCYYDEKVRRFYEHYPNGEIDDFYSDSYSDEPLARLAKRAFIVEGEKLIEWDYTKHKKHLRT